MKDTISLESFLAASDFEAHDARLIAALARAGSGVARALSGANVASTSYDYDFLGCAGSRPRNVHGELVHELDAFANDLFVAELAKESCCGGVLSEELREALDFRSHSPERFVFFDPLDGTANLEAHGLTGSIFGIAPWAGSTRASSLQPGAELVAAGYLLYSSSTLLVLANRERVDSFVWRPELDCFVASEQVLACPPSGTIYSLNEGRVFDWPEPAQIWLAGLKSGLFGRAYSQRYAGAFVADAHRALVQGGVFAYPADARAAKGKLRLQYEVNPMAFVFRAAGGAATTGSGDPLEVAPESGHERCPLVIGSRLEVESFETALAADTTRRSA
ncbi:MAG TPA: class 1 fructose-bisphosphatase [Polyangiaceae bacterium]|nr:class 1 fructose-bisphosphatase [Polyangiaceae bacterium]